MSSTLIKVMLLFRDILLECIEEGHLVMRTLNFLQRTFLHRTPQNMTPVITTAVWQGNVLC